LGAPQSLVWPGNHQLEIFQPPLPEHDLAGFQVKFPFQDKHLIITQVPDLIQMFCESVVPAFQGFCIMGAYILQVLDDKRAFACHGIAHGCKRGQVAAGKDMFLNQKAESIQLNQFNNFLSNIQPADIKVKQNF